MIRIVSEPVEDGVSQGRFGDAAVSVGDGDLGDNHGGGAAVAVVEDLQQIAGLGAGQRVAQMEAQMALARMSNSRCRRHEACLGSAKSEK